MSLTQIVECTKCHNKKIISYKPAGNRPTMPWEVWPKGCPKCGNTTVDITVISQR